jgi:hypothetical protein
VNTSQKKIARIQIGMLKTLEAAAQRGLPTKFKQKRKPLPRSRETILSR